MQKKGFATLCAFKMRFQVRFQNKLFFLKLLFFYVFFFSLSVEQGFKLLVISNTDYNVWAKQFID